jgi:hypothetical protein
MPNELPANVKESAKPVKLRDGTLEYSWPFKEAAIVLLHIKESGLTVTSIDIADESGNVYLGWSNVKNEAHKPSDPMINPHHKAMNFIESVYDRSGSKYSFIIKCKKL